MYKYQQHIFLWQYFFAFVLSFAYNLYLYRDVCMEKAVMWLVSWQLLQLGVCISLGLYFCRNFFWKTSICFWPIQYSVTFFLISQFGLSVMLDNLACVPFWKIQNLSSIWTFFADFKIKIHLVWNRQWPSQGKQQSLCQRLTSQQNDTIDLTRNNFI